MRPSLGIRGRLSLAILLTATIPLAGAVIFARNMVQQTSEAYFVPEVKGHLEQALTLYDELARATKERMRARVEVMAADERLKQAAESAKPERVEALLREWLDSNSSFVELTVEDDLGEPIARARRTQPLDPARELSLNVVRPLGTPTPRALAARRTPRDVDAGSDASSADAGAPLGQPGAEDDAEAIGYTLTALLATDKQRFDDFGAMGEFVDAYTTLSERRESDERTYVRVFAALLGFAILLAVLVGTLLARGVTRRVSELALATRRVAGGDLSIRVHEESADEIGDLGRAFNRMLSEVENSRDRIEYLSRLASWQEMARRLAHEIKNPLTPIQLAVQEVHGRLTELPPEQRRLVDATLEIVESEVQTLRRLVGEFSDFARLPESHIQQADLFEFLRELEAEGRVPGVFKPDSKHTSEPDVEFEVPNIQAPALLDRQLMRRVFINLIHNAAQAGRHRAEPIKLRITARREAEFYELLFDDDGPGVEQALRSKVFEPYVTTKDDGTGLGLAIVKKIVIEHRGHIEMLQSPQDGARVRLLLPIGGSSRSSLPELPSGIH